MIRLFILFAGNGYTNVGSEWQTGVVRGWSFSWFNKGIWLFGILR